MQPTEALQYISQCLSDYARTLPPSASMPFQQLAQEAVNTLAPLVSAHAAPDTRAMIPGDAPPERTLHAVPPPTMPPSRESPGA